MIREGDGFTLERIENYELIPGLQKMYEDIVTSDKFKEKAGLKNNVELKLGKNRVYKLAQDL